MSDSATPWTGAHQAPPSLGFSRQEYWSGVPFPSPKVKVAQSCPTLCGPHVLTIQPLGFSRPESWSRVAFSLLQGIFLTQGSNQGLLHCRRILYQLSRQGISRMHAHNRSIEPPSPPCMPPLRVITEPRAELPMLAFVLAPLKNPVCYCNSCLCWTPLVPASYSQPTFSLQLFLRHKCNSPATCPATLPTSCPRFSATPT